MGKGRKWEQTEIKEMIELYEKGMNYAQIGRSINRPLSSVNKKLSQLGYNIKTNKYTQEEIDIMSKMYLEGNTFKNIAECIGRPAPSVGHKLKSLGIAKTKLSSEHKYQVGEEINGLKIVKQTRHHINNGKAYEVQSISYPDAPTYIISEAGLKNGKGCAYTSSLRVYEGNSLYSVKRIRKYLVDIEEAKKTAIGSQKKKVFKCPDCDKEKTMSVESLVKHGIMCPMCSKYTTYPELFFMSYAEVKGLDVIYQHKLDNSMRRFDFFDAVNHIAYECNGIGHYEDSGYINYETTNKSDLEKRKYCKDNNILLVEIDCRESSFDFIKGSINNCKYLPNIENVDEEKILELIESYRNYPTKKIITDYLNGYTTSELGEKYNTSNTTICKLLRQNNVKIRKANDYKRDKINYRDVYKVDEIVELYTNGESTYSIGKLYNISYTTVNKILSNENIEMRTGGSYRKGKIKDYNKNYPVEVIIKEYKGGISTSKLGKKYNTSKTTITKILKRNNVKLRTVKNNGSPTKYRVRCITTEEIFESVAKASETLNIDASSIRHNIGGRTQSAGKHPVTGEPLRWEYVDNK